ncbi:unnamed protein product [Mesocestoides corti]|uniref:PiggyBac transposable element-derived protein domain-containing protein n=2 Tax=Mesocestoides corti TaxID=53468 RepID=A0A0R3UNN3_MESCO|nr:unnamed protein product [Mesocestoides corti]
MPCSLQARIFAFLCAMAYLGSKSTTTGIPMDLSWAYQEPSVPERAEIADFVQEMLVALTSLPKKPRRTLMDTTASFYQVGRNASAIHTPIACPPALN